VESSLFAGIVRVSHMGDRKAGADNVHTDREQVKEVTAEAKRVGVRVRMLPPELDVSGRLPLKERPALREAVEGVERGEYGGIIVAYLSRLGRNVREQLHVWDRVESAGGRIIVVRERIDTSTPSGRYVRTILAANDERELEEYTERFEQLRGWATAAGIWQRRQTPRGYRKDPATRKLVPDERAEETRQAFLRRAAGETNSSLARDLRMTPSGVRALLSNRVYLGELRVGKHVNLTAHEPLVTEEEWLAAQRHQTARPGKSNKPAALLAGLVRCASCGHVMSRTSPSGGYRYYSCRKMHSERLCPHPAAITLKGLEQAVEEIALAELGKLEATAARSDRDITAARRTLEEAERELAAYLEGVSAAGLGPGQYAEGARKRREAIDDAREHTAELWARRPGIVDGNPVRAWKRMDGAQRNRLLRGLIECVIVAPAGRGKRIPVTDRVRVIKHGTGLVRPYPGGGVSLPIRNLPFPHPDDPVVFRMHFPEDSLEHASG
jgi:DNA invertase Pin-like site-specific DNA recombinase